MGFIYEEKCFANVFLFSSLQARHCEPRSGAAIHFFFSGLLRVSTLAMTFLFLDCFGLRPRNDGGASPPQ
jgi:hypothetical protein